MAELSGLVAILNDAGTQVIEVRDLGPIPVAVKAGKVRQLVIIRPVLGADQYHGNPADNIQPAQVTRTYPVLTYDYTAIDQATLNAALVAPGSVVRALGLVMFTAVNALRVKTGDPAYTMQQFLSALEAEMR